MRLILLAALAAFAYAQSTTVGSRTNAGTQDSSGAAHTLPLKVGSVSALSSLSCTVGELYFATDATAGQNTYYCTATNTWTQQINSGGAATLGFDPGKSGSAVTIAAGNYSNPLTGVATRVTSGSSCTITAGTGTETAYFYLTQGVLNTKTLTNTISCTTGGFGSVSAITGAGANPPGSKLLFTWHATGGVWDSQASGLTDYRSVFDFMSPSGGFGIQVAPSTQVFSADQTVLVAKYQVTAPPGSIAGNLSGDIAVDTTNHHVYICGATPITAAPACTAVTTGGWQQIDGGAGGGGCTLTTGTISYTALTAAATSQEIAIMSSVSAKSRYQWVMIQEATQFTGTPSVTASMGTSGVDTDLLIPFALKQATAPQNYNYDVPKPPAVGSGTYNLVLQFVGSANLGNGTTTNMTAGSVNWEVCTTVVP